MDIFEILLVFIFFVLPLLQQLLGKRKGPEEPPESPELPREAARRDPDWGATAEPDPDAPMGLPAGWRWDDPESADDYMVPDEEALFEPVPDEETAERILTRQRHLEPVHAPEALRVASPVVSLEPLHVDRAAEHARFHAATLNQRHPPVRARKSRLNVLLGGGSGQLRRAVVLSEVLGPPRALRPLE